MRKLNKKLNRRDFIKNSSTIAGALAVGTYLPRAWAKDPLKVSAYGGYFEDSLAEFVYPEFTKATGIEVTSVSQPGGAEWFINIDTAVKAGSKPPTDVSMAGGTGPRRFNHLYTPLDESKIPNSSNIPDYLLHRKPDGTLDSVAVLAWYAIFVTNTETFPDEPLSWADFWLPKYKDSLGIPAGVTTGYMLDLTSATFFKDQGLMESKEGLTTLMKKLIELKPNVKMWFDSEGVFQSALQQGEVGAGMYYHDVTLLAIADGFPLRSTFPKEGGVIDFGNWGLMNGSEKVDEAHIFMDYTSQAEVQSAISRAMGTAPVAHREKLDLTDEEFALVSSDIPPIVPRFQTYVEFGDWMEEAWTEMITS